MLKEGILCHARASKFEHEDLSLADVQQRRSGKRVPNGLPLHRYANLYFHARNPMMYRRKAMSSDLCVLRISNRIINLEGVVLTDQNAASDYVRFFSPDEYRSINFDWVFADDWTDDDQVIQWRKASAKCAEVLVPEKIAPEYIIGAYVVNNTAAVQLNRQGFDKQVDIQ